MGNKTSKIIEISEFEILTTLYNTLTNPEVKSVSKNQKWDELIDKINPYLFPPYLKPGPNIGPLISTIIVNMPQEKFELLVNKKGINRYTILTILKHNPDRLEYVLKSNPSKYLIPTIKILSVKYDIHYVKFLLNLGINTTPSSILSAIEYGNNSMALLLLDKLTYKHYPQMSKEETLIKLYNCFLQYTVIHCKKDILISLMEKIRFEQIDFNKLYENCKKQTMKSFLDTILTKKLEKVIR